VWNNAAVNHLLCKEVKSRMVFVRENRREMDRR